MPSSLNFTDADFQQHQIFNELDRHGLALGLKRLNGERNAEYKQRLMDVFVHRANSTYAGLIHGITRELGLAIDREMLITPVSGAVNTHNGLCISFKDTRCCIYEDYYTDIPEHEIERWELEVGAGYTVTDLKTAIEATSLFDVTLLGDDPSKRSMCIFEQTSAKNVRGEILTGKGSRINLDNQGVIEGSEYIVSNTLKNKITDLNAVLGSGDYRINYVTGTIECSEIPASGSMISYQHRNDEFLVMSSPVIVNSLQNEHFKKFLFQQILQSDDTYVNGLPTSFGADVINELLSVYPTTYKA
ncbi:MAG TPA: hypothetical protein QF753_23340 [Victivallales bacterium]|jgi:hypothetical protein|nr:hypothetical protein [Victivallales bacterium]